MIHFSRSAAQIGTKARWYGDDDRAMMIDLDAGKVRAVVEHDGHGKFYPAVYVSVFAALWLFLTHEARGFLEVKTLRFPLCVLGYYRFKSIDEAQAAAECLL